MAALAPKLATSGNAGKDDIMTTVSEASKPLGRGEWAAEHVGNWAYHQVLLYIDNDRHALKGALQTAQAVRVCQLDEDRAAELWRRYFRSRIAVPSHRMRLSPDVSDDAVTLQLHQVLGDLLELVDWHAVAEHYAAKWEASE